MDVKIYAIDGFKKGGNHSMDGTCRENSSFLSKGVKQSLKKAWEGLFLMSTAMNNYVAYSSLISRNIWTSIPCTFRDQGGGESTGQSIGKVNYSRDRTVEDWTSGTSAICEPQCLKFSYKQDTRLEILMIRIDVADLTLLEKTKSRAGPLEA